MQTQDWTSLPSSILRGHNRDNQLLHLPFFLYSKRENYILIKQPHQVTGAEQKIEYNENIKEKKRPKRRGT
jgi:hypothetical protein